MTAFTQPRLVLKIMTSLLASGVIGLAGVGPQGAGRGNDDPTLLRELPSAPHEEAWRSPSPGWNTSTVKVANVNRSRSVFFTPDRSAELASSGHLALMDSATRRVVWDVRVPALNVGGDGYLESRVVGGILIQQFADDRLHAVDLSTGRVLSVGPRSARLVGCDGYENSRCVDLDGDVLLRSGSTVERARARDLSRPKWRTLFHDAIQIAVSGRKVVGGSKAVDIATGRRVAWSGRAQTDYSNDGALLYAIDSLEDDVIYLIVDPITGATRARIRMGADGFLGMDADLLIYKRQGTIRAVDSHSGRERWRIPLNAANDIGAFDLPVSSGLVAVPSAVRPRGLDLVERSTGKKVTTVVLRSGKDSASMRLVGTTGSSMLLADGKSLESVGLRSGGVAWSYRPRGGLAVDTVGDELIRVAPREGTSLASLVDG